tara:strand:+ start:1074 stop:2252 length:1179 start_codon:yes stop_codon:yes gene_type:complete
MSSTPRTSVVRAYDCVVKNDVNFLPNTVNNYVGAIQTDTLTTDSFSNLTVTSGYWSGQSSWPIRVLSTSGSGSGFRGTASVDSLGNISIDVIDSGTGYNVNDTVVFYNSTVDDFTGIVSVDNDVIQRYNQDSAYNQAWPKDGSDHRAIFYIPSDLLSGAALTNDQSTLFEGTITRTGRSDFEMTITKPGFGFTSSDGLYHFGVVGKSHLEYRFTISRIRSSTPSTAVIIGSVGDTFSSMQITATISSIRRIWPRTGDATTDTSQFHLPVNLRNVFNFEIVSVSILHNNTVNNVTPEFLVLENGRSSHIAINSKSHSLDNVIQLFNSTSSNLYEKQYGALQYTILTEPSNFISNLHVRFYNADLQPFDLSSELTHDGVQRAFRVVLSIRYFIA